MATGFEGEIRSIAEKMIENLSQVTLFEKTPKERFEDILTELRKKGEIIDFLPKPKDVRFKDFAVIIENKGKYDTVGVTVKEREEEIDGYMKRQDQLREQISKYRKFIERFVLTVNSKKTDENLKWQLIKAIKQYQES